MLKKILLYTIVGCLLGMTALVVFPLLILLIPIIGVTFLCFRGKKNPNSDVPAMPRIIPAEYEVVDEELGNEKDTICNIR